MIPSPLFFLLFPPLVHYRPPSSFNFPRLALSSPAAARPVPVSAISVTGEVRSLAFGASGKDRRTFPPLAAMPPVLKTIQESEREGGKGEAGEGAVPECGRERYLGSHLPLMKTRRTDVMNWLP